MVRSVRRSRVWMRRLVGDVTRVAVEQLLQGHARWWPTGRIQRPCIRREYKRRDCYRYERAYRPWSNGYSPFRWHALPLVLPMPLDMFTGSITIIFEQLRAQAKAEHKIY